MTNKIKDLLYNPSSISSVVQQTQAVNLHRPYQTHSRDEALVVLVKTLAQAQNSQTVISHFTQMEELVRAGVSYPILNLAVKKLNVTLPIFFHQYPSQNQIYQACLNFLATLKEKLDESAEQGLVEQRAWVDLETSLYWLTEWEQGLSV